MKPPVRDFPALIRWLAKHHHEGVIDKVADTVGISGALADKWAKGRVKMPTFTTVDKLCGAYELDFDWVRKLIGRAVVVLAILFAGLLATGGVVADARTLSVVFTTYLLSEVALRRRAKFRLWPQFFVGVFPSLEAQPQAMWHAARLA